MNKSVFSSKKINELLNIKANTVNEAGGIAYSNTDENALAQLVVTGTISNTFYSTADEQLDTILKFAGKCSDEFVAKAAVYGHEVAGMKDTPALLLAILSTRNAVLVAKVFDRVVTNQKMLRNFVQIIRSGKVGRKSFGTSIKRLIQKWLAKQKSDYLFKGAVGNSPSLADVVKMVHPKPENAEKEAFYGWLLDKKYNEGALSCSLKKFEDFKKGKTTDLPDCDFRMLTPFLTPELWKKVALQLPWNALRMNLNTLARHGALKDDIILKHVIDKLKDKEQVKKHNVFPYQLLSAYKATGNEIPSGIKLALELAMEHATENTPVLNGKTVVCIDTSGSMSSPITGNRGVGQTSTVSCIDAAALFAASLAKNNQDLLIIPFDTKVHEFSYNRYTSVMQTASTLARFGGGGTDCACAMRYINDKGIKADNVIFISDNESWYNPTTQRDYGRRSSTGLVSEWVKFKNWNPKSKLVCIDIQPNTTTQVPNLPKEVLNIAGFSDTIWTPIANFLNRNLDADFKKVIEDKISL